MSAVATVVERLQDRGSTAGTSSNSDDIDCSCCLETPTKKPKLSAQHLLNVASSPPTTSSRTQVPIIPSTNDDKDKDEPIIFTKNADSFDAIYGEHVQLVVWRRSKLPTFVEKLSDPNLDQSKLPSFYGKVTPKTVVQLMTTKLLHDKIKDNGPLDTSMMLELIQDVRDLVNAFDRIVNGREGGEEQELEEGDEGGSSPNDDGSVHVRLECLSGNGCQYWHQDTVPVRLVATYRGPCTEYVEPAHSVETLKSRQFDSSHSISLTHYDVALFKGRTYDDDEDESHYSDEEGEKAGEEGVQPDTAGEDDNNNNNKDDGDDDDDESDLTSPGIVHRSPRIEGSDVVRLVLVLDIPAPFHEDDDTSDV